MKKKMSFGCVFGAVIIILLSSMQLSVVSQTLEPYNELECVPDIYIKSDIGTEIEDLPYFLDDTILDGNMRVIVTKDGLPPRGSTPDDYDKVISLKEKNCIIEDARERFIGTYGIDPYISKDEKIGFHKGALATLTKEREEMIRILQIVEQLMQMHIKELKDLGIDLAAQAKEVKELKGKKPIEDIL